jgi:hypothetical protein
MPQTPTPPPTTPSSPSTPGSKPSSDEADWRRRKRLAAVFGDVLPDTTSDERELGSAGRSDEADRGDRWLREQVPPHHG